MAFPSANRTICHLIITNNQHIGYLLQLGLTDTVSQLFITVVHLSPNTAGFQLTLNPFSIIQLFIRNRQDLNLYRGQPGRESSSIVFNQNPHKPLQTAIDSPMNHCRSVFITILPHIAEIKALRHLEVQLNGPTLPGPSQGILQMKVYLWSIKGSISLIKLIIKTIVLNGLSQGS